MAEDVQKVVEFAKRELGVPISAWQMELLNMVLEMSARTGKPVVLQPSGRRRKW